jgi:hypothetical protein
MTTERVVIVGGPRCGKSWLADELADHIIGCRVFCGDPKSKVKEPLAGINYLPEGLDFGSESSQWIVDNWLTLPGPWVMEGHIMARVLRKWMRQFAGVEFEAEFPCDEIYVFTEQRPELDLLPGQVSLHRGVMTEWEDCREYYEPITEYR